MEIGEAVFFPGEESALLPVYITAAEDLILWQMGLDYDDLILSVTGIDFNGTVSEPLAPEPLLAPSAPPHEAVGALYTYGSPFPAGVHQLAAYLRIEVVNPGGLPPGPGGIIATGIQIAGGPEPYPLLFATVPGGSIVTPLTVGGTVFIYTDDVLEVGETQGNAFTLPATVPVRLWSTDSAGTLMMGLDYDDLILISVDFSGTVIEEVASGGCECSYSAENGHLSIEIDLAGAILPPVAGEVVAWLSLDTAEPLQGAFPLDLIPGECTLDTEPISHLFSGGMTLLNHFLRGDVNYDGHLGLDDAQLLIVSVVDPDTTLSCPDSGDVNDDGSANVADVVYLLNHLYAGGEPPAEPYTEPGPDPTDDDGLPCLP
ncbi:MAG: hypothetical protein ACE5GW_07285 [Planctomycetota bacterium]